MKTSITVDKPSKTPKYLQISNAIIDSIENGKLKKGSKLPSINEVCLDNQLARETVVKAFGVLKEKGLIASVHGKGFYVSSTATQVEERVFILFDTFASYKETLYHGIKEAFGPKVSLDIYFHHFNMEMFQQIIATHVGHYTSYIVLPINHRGISKALAPIPDDKLFLIDVLPDQIKEYFSGVYQDFRLDMIESLQSILAKIKKYRMLKLVFRNTITEVPKKLEDGFRTFCASEGIEHQVIYKKLRQTDVEKGCGYIVIDDEDLVTLVESAKEKELKLGKDVGVISYNDTPLKKVVGNGISVISTDFRAMGRQIAQQIQDQERKVIRNPTAFVHRGSF